jgi:hypothetical protein
MKLEYVRCISPGDLRMHPQGYYWYAVTDDGRHDGSGNDALSAVVDMVESIELEIPEEKVKGD